MLEIENGQGAVALDQQQWMDLRNGFGVIPATSLGGVGTECEVTINTGTLGSGDNALSVASGDVLFDGSVTSVSSQNVDITTGDGDPRKDVVYIDTNGDAQVNVGSPASVPSEAPGDRFQTWKPAPYDMHDVSGVVLATVWVPASASSITATDLRDRRLRADLEVNDLGVQTTTSKVTNGQVYAGHSDFSTVQDAIDYANNNSHNVVLVPPGSYGSIDIPTEIHVQGLGARMAFDLVVFDGGTSDHAVALTGRYASVENVAAKTTAGGGNSFDAFNGGTNNDLNIVGCWAKQSDRHGYFFDGSRCELSGSQATGGSIDSNDVDLGSNSSICVIDGNINLSVTDGGSNNVVGDNS